MKINSHHHPSLLPHQKNLSPIIGNKARVSAFASSFYLEFDSFTMLYSFLLYNKMNQWHVYIYPLPPKLPSHHPLIPSVWLITEHQSGLPTLYSSFPLVICFTHGNCTLSIWPSSFPPYDHKSILYICASIPVLQINSLVPFSRFHIHVLIYDICFSLSYFTLYDLPYNPAIPLLGISPEKTVI